MSNNRRLGNILLTGGAGFIGSNFVHRLFSKMEFEGKLVNVDMLTYAGDLKKLEGLDESLLESRYFFVQADICDKEKIAEVFKKYDIDTVVHMAAESHVDRSITSPDEFLQTNIMGTFNLLQAARNFWGDRKDVLFHHVSTDEVYGSLGDEGYFTEDTAYDPRSPYSASKASSDHIVRAFHHTFGLPITISNCSNNYGARQNKEKLIPLIISNILKRKKLPVYGEGKNIRDWIFVDDHNDALWTILNKGESGSTYNVGGNNEIKNIDLVHMLCEKLAKKQSIDAKDNLDLIEFVTDRLGHDHRYAIDNSKIRNELGFENSVNFEEGLEKTIDWYLEQQ